MAHIKATRGRELRADGGGDERADRRTRRLAAAAKQHKPQRRRRRRRKCLLGREQRADCCRRRRAPIDGTRPLGRLAIEPTTSTATRIVLANKSCGIWLRFVETSAVQTRAIAMSGDEDSLSIKHILSRSVASAIRLSRACAQVCRYEMAESEFLRELEQMQAAAANTDTNSDEFNDEGPVLGE